MVCTIILSSCVRVVYAFVPNSRRSQLDFCRKHTSYNGKVTYWTYCTNKISNLKIHMLSISSHWDHGNFMALNNCLYKSVLFRTRTKNDVLPILIIVLFYITLLRKRKRFTVDWNRILFDRYRIPLQLLHAMRSWFSRHWSCVDDVLSLHLLQGFVIRIICFI